ncbi:MAG: 5'/3'-nucleotidase SurE [Spirochaetales bacterium]
MNILITNDDGIDSPGLQALVDALSPDHAVEIIAPDGQRSGTSHYLTMHEAIRCRRVGDRARVISGSPADCVILGVLGALDTKPDVVLSGINLGANLGTDVVYSGTAAAARQAAFMGVPGIALSLTETNGTLNFRPLTNLVTHHLPELMDLWDADHFVNVNAPNTMASTLPIDIGRLCQRIYDDNLHAYTAPGGDVYYFLDGSLDDSAIVEGTDWGVVQSGAIAVSPVSIHPCEYPGAEKYRQARFLE